MLILDDSDDFFINCNSLIFLDGLCVRLNIVIVYGDVFLNFGVKQWTLSLSPYTSLNQ